MGLRDEDRGQGAVVSYEDTNLPDLRDISAGLLFFEASEADFAGSYACASGRIANQGLEVEVGRV